MASWQCSFVFYLLDFVHQNPKKL